jgi:hypothetical protein
MRWKCPLCKKEYARKNQYHMCETSSLDSLLKGLDPQFQKAYRAYHAYVKKFKGVRFSTSKKAVTFSTDKAFTFAHPKTVGVDICFFLAETVNDLLIFRTQRYSQKKVAHFVRLERPQDLTRQVKQWIKVAYHLSQPKKKTNRPRTLSKS